MCIIGGVCGETGVWPDPRGCRTSGKRLLCSVFMTSLAARCMASIEPSVPVIAQGKAKSARVEGRGLLTKLAINNSLVSAFA